VALLELLRVLGGFFAPLAVKICCFSHQEQQPLTAKFAKESRQVRKEIPN